MDPRPASTVILARQAAGGIEVLVERRAPGSRFAPGFVVFPGGLLEPADETLAGSWFGDAGQAPRACALRELYEETGLLLTSSGLTLRPGSGAVDEIAFDPPASASLVEVARWVAPEFLEVRFDTWFFAVAAPDGLEPSPDGTEIARAWWTDPADVLARSTRGEAPLMWPTLVTLGELAECGSVDEVLALRIEQVRPPEPGEVSSRYRGAWQRPERNRVSPLNDQ